MYICIYMCIYMCVYIYTCLCMYVYICIYSRPLPTAEGARQRKIVVSSESVFSLCHLGARRTSGSATLELEARSAVAERRLSGVF